MSTGCRIIFCIEVFDVNIIIIIIIVSVIVIIVGQEYGDVSVIDFISAMMKCKGPISASTHRNIVKRNSCLKEGGITGKEVHITRACFGLPSKFFNKIGLANI